MGGNGNKSPDEDKRAFAEFNAQQEYVEGPVKGQFTFRVTSLDLIPHREVIAKVDKYWQVDNQAWFRAQVIYDSKGCETGNGSGGHSDGCSDSDAGGCSGDDTEHDGGCSGDHTDDGSSGGETDTGCGEDHTDGTDHTDGGCSGDDTGGSPGGDMGGSPGGDTGGGCGEDHTDGTDHTDGGCSGDDTGGSPGGDTGGGCGEDHTDGTDHTDGGCSDDHSDGTDHTDGGCSGDDTGGSPGGPSGDKGSSTKGKNCRVGQYVYVKAYDYSTPAIDGDVLGWKWFSPDGNQPKDGHQPQWKLCEKTVIGGNLVVHN